MRFVSGRLSNLYFAIVVIGVLSLIAIGVAARQAQPRPRPRARKAVTPIVRPLKPL